MKRGILFGILVAFFAASAASSSVFAIDLFKKVDCANNQAGCDVVKTDTLNQDSGQAVKNGINTAIIILGSISVLMIVIGGVKYVVSGGDSAGVQSAKNTILYAVIGVVVAVLAYAIVNFVIGYL